MKMLRSSFLSETVALVQTTTKENNMLENKLKSVSLMALKFDELFKIEIHFTWS